MPEHVFEQRQLSEITLAIKDGTHGTFRRIANGVPFLSAKNVSESGQVEWNDSDDRISEEDYLSIISSFSPASSDLLLTIVGTLGRRALFRGEKVAFQRSVAFVRPDLSQIVPSFFFHSTGSFNFYRQLVQRSNATAQAGLYLGELAKTVVPLPSKSEQSRIVYVLDIIDQAIAKTSAAIAKLKQIQAGLVHDLLTRGLDKNGKLRDPIAHPGQFKDSSLGRIPKEWEIVLVRSEASIEHGFAFDGRRFSDKPVGPRLLVPGNFHRDGGLYFTDHNTKYFAGEFPSGAVLHNGDILIVMTDLSPMTLILGRTVLLNEPFVLLHNQRLGKFCLRKPADWNPAFFVALMNDDRLRSRVIREATGTTVHHTSPDRIANGLGVKPKRGEQERIMSVITKIDLQSMRYYSELSKLLHVKSGLMSDLLTGRVRVPESMDVRTS